MRGLGFCCEGVEPEINVETFVPQKTERSHKGKDASVIPPKRKCVKNMICSCFFHCVCHKCLKTKTRTSTNTKTIYAAGMIMLKGQDREEEEYKRYYLESWLWSLTCSSQVLSFLIPSPSLDSFTSRKNNVFAHKKRNNLENAQKHSTTMVCKKKKGPTLTSLRTQNRKGNK
ncbi:hypothetical protein VNO77_10254 [Canavalia gladiata]|uniref:Uncharacterized protein n=1 Tax=Canavalia gladiata TaxID=3824 RepID=A0AAN9QUM5_CANGL